MKNAPISAPHKPRVHVGLPIWQGDTSDARLEIDECRLEAGDFSMITHLLADACHIERSSFSVAQLVKCELTDTLVSKAECVGMKAPESSWLRVEAIDCRMTGVDFGASHFEDCTFTGLKLDEAGFRFASFKRVRFERCVLRNADFSNAKLHHVTFSECEFDSVNFGSAQCNSVDVRDQNLNAVSGVRGLSNATITSEQLIQIAPLLAAELNFHVND